MLPRLFFTDFAQIWNFRSGSYQIEIVQQHHIFAQELIWVHSDDISWSWRQKQEKCSKPVGFCQERVVDRSWFHNWYLNGSTNLLRGATMLKPVAIDWKWLGAAHNMFEILMSKIWNFSFAAQTSLPKQEMIWLRHSVRGHQIWATNILAFPINVHWLRFWFATLLARLSCIIGPIEFFCCA